MTSDFRSIALVTCFWVGVFSHPPVRRRTGGLQHGFAALWWGQNCNQKMHFTFINNSTFHALVPLCFGLPSSVKSGKLHLEDKQNEEYCSTDNAKKYKFNRLGCSFIIEETLTIWKSEKFATCCMSNQSNYHSPCYLGF